MTTTYTITSSAGQTMGTYSGETPAHALAAMHRDAGYRSVRIEDGELVFPDADTEALCGGLDVWTVTPVDPVAAICAEPCGECGGRLVPTDLSDRTRTLRGRTTRYPAGLLIPTCEGCGAITTDAALSNAIEAGGVPVVTGTIYTNPSGLGEGWDDRNAADRAFADALAAHFDALGWDITVKRGEGDAYVEGADEREVAHEVGRVFEAFCTHNGDADATTAALHGEDA